MVSSPNDHSQHVARKATARSDGDECRPTYWFGVAWMTLLMSGVMLVGGGALSGQAGVPVFGFMLIGIAVFVGLFAWPSWRKAHDDHVADALRRQHLCGRCGYDLRGCDADARGDIVCPECGEVNLPTANVHQH